MKKAALFLLTLSLCLSAPSALADMPEDETAYMAIQQVFKDGAFDSVKLQSLEFLQKYPESKFKNDA